MISISCFFGPCPNRKCRVQTMAQNDFLSLALGQQCEADLPLLMSPPKAKASVCMEDADYVPVNFIPDEVRAMIKAWELAHLKQLEPHEAPGTISTDTTHHIAMVTDEMTQDHSTPDVQEPRRYITDNTPPKRFYRTFWRSVVRRALARETEGVFAQKGADAL